MSEGLRRIATVFRVLGWLWLALFVALACVFGYGRERDLSRDELIALYEQQTQSKLIDVVAAQRASMPQPTSRQDQKSVDVDEWLGKSAAPTADSILAAHFKDKTPTARDREWLAAVFCIAGGLAGFATAFALAWIVNGFAVDKSKR
ncbi:hypothetical protein [Cupriavidus necator]|uniref:hypothetical protein n=1 Tax=Cupriavidus necator TaxID=106590 RepID=UPI00339D868B